MAFATGRHMTRAALSHAFTPDHVAALVMAVHAGRVVFHDGDGELAPGLSLHRVGGHTDGLQVVRVHTEVGWIVLASDATHYYENFSAGRPFPIVFDVGAMLEGYETLRRLADAPELVVPGHDPLVLERYARHARTGRHRRPPRRPPDLTRRRAAGHRSPRRCPNSICPISCTDVGAPRSFCSIWRARAARARAPLSVVCPNSCTTVGAPQVRSVRFRARRHGGRQPDGRNGADALGPVRCIPIAGHMLGSGATFRTVRVRPWSGSRFHLTGRNHHRAAATSPARDKGP